MSTSTHARASEESFDSRYGPTLVRRGIATFPTVLLRHQAELGLNDGHIVLLATILGFYSRAGGWPSLSMAHIRVWRGISRRKLAREVADLERLRFLSRHGRTGYRTRVYDLSALLARLEELAQEETSTPGS